MQLAFVLGRLPRLALKELEATATTLPFHWSLTSVQSDIVRLKPETEEVEGSGYLSLKDPNVKSAVLQLQRRMGGTLRIVYLHQQCERGELPPALLKMVEELYQGSTGKLTFGISVWGGGVQPFHLVKGLKKQLQSQGHSVRFVIPKQGEQTLSTAQVFHNDLAFWPAEGKKLELVCMQEGKRWWIGYTLTVQDIEAYSQRDFSIPAPDPVSGMLSPKLAQTMLNLAVDGATDATIYDPFCGNGRLVLEAWYMGLKGYGSDIVPKKVSSAQENLAWLTQEFSLEIPDPRELIWEMDATSSDAPVRAAEKMTKPWHVVGEPYLGRPLRHPLTEAEAEEWRAELTPLFEKFFENWSNTTHRPASMLIVCPRVRLQGGGDRGVYDQIVDRLAEFGYSSEVLFCYDRPDSIVRRDLVRISYTK